MQSIQNTAPGSTGSSKPGSTPIPASSRDQAGWRRFVERYDSALAEGVCRGFRRAGRRARRDEVREMVQDSYCRLLDHQGRRLEVLRGRQERVVVAYLRRLATHATLERLRSASCLKRGGPGRSGRSARPGLRGPAPPGDERGWVLVSRDELRPGRGGVQEKVLRDTASREESPEELLLRRERRRLFLRRCRELSRERPGRRDVHIFLLAVLGGWSSRRISASAYPQLSPSGVDSVVSRMRRRLQDLGIALPRRSTGLPVA